MTLLYVLLMTKYPIGPHSLASLVHSDPYTCNWSLLPRFARPFGLMLLPPTHLRKLKHIHSILLLLRLLHCRHRHLCEILPGSILIFLQ